MWSMTMSLLLFYLLHTAPAVCNEPWSELPELTGELCPNTCIWKNRTQDSSRNYCCKDCSCDMDCGQACCFPERDEHTRQRTSLYSCTAAVTRPTSNEEPAFYMIDKNPSGGCLVAVKDLHSNDQCGDYDVADWGSLYPVVSKSTMKIYRNEICAKCHNDTNYVKWDVRQVCAKPANDYQYIFNVVDVDVAFQHYSGRCRLAFETNDFTNELKNKRCIREVINNCQNPSSFVLLEGMNLSRADIAKACESGFYSPVESFANVYCWMCSVKDAMALPNCNYGSTYGTGKNFLMLIDAQMIKRRNNQNSATIPKSMACKRTKKTNKQDCVTILCPVGQMRIVNICDFPTKEWGQAFYSIWIKLVPVEELGPVKRFVDVLRKLSTSELREMVTTSDLGKRWKYITLYGLINLPRNMEHWHLLLYVQIYPDGSINPDVLLKGIKTSMTSGNVTFRIGNIAVNFSQEFSELSPNQKDYPSTTTEPKQYKMLTRLITSATSGGSSLQFTITKLFFCEQITLENKESYVLSKSGDLLFYKPLQIYMYTNEFYLAYSSPGEMRPRICLSDSDYIPTKSGAKHLFLGKLWIGVELVIIVVALLLNM